MRESKSDFTLPYPCSPSVQELPFAPSISSLCEKKALKSKTRSHDFQFSLVWNVIARHVEHLGGKWRLDIQVKGGGTSNIELRKVNMLQEGKSPVKTGGDVDLD